MSEETVLRKFRKDGWILTVTVDQDPVSPRERPGNLGCMALFHGRHDLPNESGKTLAEFVEGFQTHSADVIHLHVYCMDHSGLTFRTDPRTFRAIDPQCWDWGQVGEIYVPLETARREFPELSGKELSDRVTEELEREVEELNSWYNGQCWLWHLEGPDGLQDSGTAYGGTLEEAFRLDTLHALCPEDILNHEITE